MGEPGEREIMKFAEHLPESGEHGRRIGKEQFVVGGRADGMDPGPRQNESDGRGRVRRRRT